MPKTVKEKLEFCLRSFTEPKINYLTLTFKDKELNAKFTQITRQTAHERAKIYLIVLAVSIVF